MTTLILIPTYNELANLPIIVNSVRGAVPNADILIIDDGSPDGTGALADEMALADSQLHVMHRTVKSGLGDAYIAGFTWGLDRGYDVLVEMDADGSHPSESLASLIASVTPAGSASLAQTPGLAIGSRWVAGGSVVNWAPHRLVLSRGGNSYARALLGLNVKDATAGFRAFRADVLRTIHFEDVHSHGYCFQIDMTLRVSDAGFTIVEIPIEFRERTLGESKMSQAIVLEAMSKVTVWGAQRAWRKLFGRGQSGPVADHGEGSNP
jgi:dolichol-phosphate mannosyltransferase